MGASWYVCQIGAREHYSVARALHQRSRLEALITDAWSMPGSVVGRLSNRLEQRYHPELSDAFVRAASSKSIIHRLKDRLVGRSGWDSILQRNQWFSNWAAAEIMRNERNKKSADTVVFAYSYAARDIFRETKRAGFRAVLGQIDPGPVEAQLVAELYAEQDQADLLDPIPERYWEEWREEVELADTILVNSKWSADCLVKDGVTREKIEIVPLALGHAIPVQSVVTRPEISTSSPLKLLFLGQVTLRKGIHLIFEMLQLLPDAPLQVNIVGDVQVDIPDWVNSDKRIKLHGRVNRDDVWSFYQNADVFLFPTYSDGFGLTQLEAIAAGVPLISSNRCGAVVQHKVNGHLMEELSAACMSAVIQDLLQNPAQLRAWKTNCRREGRFDISTLAEALLKI